MNTNHRIGRTQLIPSDQVDRNRSVDMLVMFHKLQHVGYSEFTSENFRQVRTGSLENYPETVFSNLGVFFIGFLHIATTNSPCSMWNISGISKIHFPVCCPAWRHTRNMHTGGPKQLCRLTVTLREWRGRSWHRVDRFVFCSVGCVGDRFVFCSVQDEVVDMNTNHV